MKKMFIAIFLTLLLSEANSTIYYVSDSGNDLNPGITQLLPWQTISKVNSMMSIFLPGDQILFQKGDRFSGPLNITKSGTAGNYLTFGSYGSGNLPVISGKKLVTGWNLYSGSIYRAYVGDTVSAVYVSNKIMTIARYPNSEFLRTDYSGGNTGFYDAALTQSSGYWNGATCRIRTINWAYETRTVSNFSGGNVTFSATTVYSAYTNYGYYFDNKLNLLDTGGEWYYDIPSGYLYFHAPNSVNPNTLSIEAVTEKQCIYGILGSRYIKIKDLKISGSSQSGIDLYTAHNIDIQGCYINHTGTFGILLNGSNNLIENNSLEDNLSTAISGVITNGIIKNNIINRTGLIAGYGLSAKGYTAMSVNVCQGTIVELNNIDSSGYNGISVAKNTIVRNNIIDYSCLVLNDGGGIDFTDCDTLQILNNIVSNTIGNFETSGVPNSYSSGIYGNGALMKNSIIQGNTVCHNRYMGIAVDHKNFPVNNKIIGNICYNNFSSQILFADYSAAVFVPSYNTIIKGNIFYSLSSSQNCMELMGFTSSGISDFGLFDSNYYCNPYSEILIRRTTFLPSYTTNFISLSAWKANFGEDINSKSLPFSFSQFAVTDTLSNNLITNSTFTNTVNDWGGWPQGLTIGHVNHPLLNNGSMRTRWNGLGYSEGFTLSNFYPITNGYNYLVSLSAVGNHSGKFNLWGRSSFSGALQTFPQTFFTYANYRKDYSLIFKADTTDPNAHLSVGLKLPDSLLYVDNVHVYRVEISRIDSTQASKIFINKNNYPASFSLGGIPYKDLDGNPVTGSILLQPYSSRILVNENYTLTSKNLQLKIFIQGLYNASINSSISDTVKVYMRNSSSPYNIVDSSKAVVNPEGNGSFVFSNAANSVNYYLVTNHRNTIETWSKLPVTFTANTLSYDFTTAANKAYGDNLILKGTKYCIYSGDIDQDDFVDIGDYALVDNAAKNFLTGYRKEDINGDGVVDLADVSYVENNATRFIETERP